MMPRRNLFVALLLALSFPFTVTANDFEVDSLSGNGRISWFDTNTNGHYRVEWSSSLNTNWCWDWDNLLQVPATGGVVEVSIPMFFRVVHFPPQAYAGPTELRLVSGGGQLGGPNYDFYMGKYEVTELEFVAFLNDAEANQGNVRGTNMYFDVNGDIYMSTTKNSWETLFDISNSKLIYSPALALGSRYSCFADRTNHPVTGVSWYGALKFCNWLTVNSGRGESQRCFSEGKTYTNWHPANVSYAAWADGYDNAERLDWVNNYHGFRLPMDDYSDISSYFNESYKASAWTGSSNTLYGYGRGTITTQDANYASSKDPYEALAIQTTPVGYYDGSSHGGAFQTRSNNNYYGIYDLSGNVSELIVDNYYSGDNSYEVVRGGSWGDGSGGSYLRTDYRYVAFTKGQTSPYVGFRVVTTFP